VFLVLAGLLLPLPFPLAARATEEVRVTLNIPGEVSVGSDLSAVLEISAVENFDAALFRGDFDPAVLGVTSVSGGNIGGTAIPVAASSQEVPGRIAVMLNVAGVTGLTGSGYLVELHLKALAAGSSALAIPILSLSNARAETIAAVASGASVVVYKGAPPSAAPASLENPGTAAVAAPGNPSEPPSPSPAHRSFLSTYAIWMIAIGVALVIAIVFITLAIRRRGY